MKKIDTYQKNILDLLKRLDKNKDNHSFSIRQIGTIVGLNHPQKVLNRLDQLEKDGYIIKEENGLYRVIKDYIGDLISMPFYGFSQCGNIGGETIEEIPKDIIEIPLKLLGNIKESEIKNCFFTKAKGNSMEPVIKENDLLLIKKQEYDESDSMFLVILDGKPKIKKIKKNGKILYLVSINTSHSNFEIDTFNSEIRVVGKVRQIVSNY